jgi:anti-sigma28 factor (negative regulator of flagellin synthesis)
MEKQNKPPSRANPEDEHDRGTETESELENDDESEATLESDTEQVTFEVETGLSDEALKSKIERGTFEFNSEDDGSETGDGLDIASEQPLSTQTSKNKEYKFRYPGNEDQALRRPNLKTRTLDTRPKIDSSAVPVPDIAAKGFTLYRVTKPLGRVGKAISRTGKAILVQTTNFRHWGLWFQGCIYHLVQHQTTHEIFWDFLEPKDSGWHTFSSIDDKKYSENIGHASSQVSSEIIMDAG